jgi:hypothetical protein
MIYIILALPVTFAGSVCVCLYSALSYASVYFLFAAAAMLPCMIGFRVMYVNLVGTIYMHASLFQVYGKRDNLPLFTFFFFLFILRW